MCVCNNVLPHTCFVHAELGLCESGAPIWSIHELRTWISQGLLHSSRVLISRDGIPRSTGNFPKIRLRHFSLRILSAWTGRTAANHRCVTARPEATRRRPQGVKEEMNDWVALYRRQDAVVGRPADRGQFSYRPRRVVPTVCPLCLVFTATGVWLHDADASVGQPGVQCSETGSCL